MIPFLHGLNEQSKKFTNTFGIRFKSWPLFVLGLAILFTAFVFIPGVVSFAISLSLFLAPLWLPFLVVGGAIELWLVLKRSEFIAAQQYILLEIKPPRNLVKTPLAMEAFLASTHLSPGEATWYVRWILGRVRPWWSLEIASFEGKVHFFIWTRANFRRIIESQMYAQYPGVQIVEAPDYTRLISATPEEWGIWGCDYKHTAKDPLPIKTYVEYGLDKVQKEPEQVDPLANLIEFMSSVGKDEYLWLQLIIRVHKGEKYHKHNAKGKPYTWIDEAEELVQEIREKTRDVYTDALTGEERPGFPNPTKGQIEKIAAIERNVSKQGFDVGGRCIYLAKPEAFNPIMINHMVGLFKPFSTEGWNGIKSAAWLKRFDDYPWEFGIGKLKDKYRRKLIQAYRRRQFFFDPFSYGVSKDEVMVMSTEELATIFHIPSRAVETPGLERIQSATGQAPANLPI
ncbi:hypothetical protein COW49_01025 [Candidatus Kaiserbacteria bacterium CG17_big_fil_post_rev_8_21_14_2_50_51_7]|uniref:DUF8128 domain-containing protein n=1 Tax=Candidatus Kaiserbacteria bacterium CG17_big_fil_post_rev_8_21_14_2_50_51_7 TaxID=1974613 RepID=A0A2M7FE69_9BACT|nr:MAG: hypothetical protein COW49_01025 [Candidatus Kaiserbacteria bacterium CG17_big_fil_post_rev_8_21_14_2_50_51_7]